MADITKGETFANGETVTVTRLNNHVDNATITFSTADDTDNSTLEVSGNKFRVKDAGITAAKTAVGFPVQVRVARNTTYSSSTTTRAVNDTAPSITDGVEIGTLSITPTSSSNTVLARASGALVMNAAMGVIVMLFRGSTCIASTYVFGFAQNVGCAYSLEVLDTPGTTSPTTYSVRAAGTISSGFYINGYWNGAAGSRVFGGTQGQTLTLTEIRA